SVALRVLWQQGNRDNDSTALSLWDRKEHPRPDRRLVLQLALVQRSAMRRGEQSETAWFDSSWNFDGDGTAFRGLKDNLKGTFSLDDPAHVTGLHAAEGINLQLLRILLLF